MSLSQPLDAGRSAWLAAAALFLALAMCLASASYASGRLQALANARADADQARILAAELVKDPEAAVTAPVGGAALDEQGLLTRIESAAEGLGQAAAAPSSSFGVEAGNPRPRPWPQAGVGPEAGPSAEADGVRALRSTSGDREALEVRLDGLELGEILVLLDRLAAGTPPLAVRRIELSPPERGTPWLDDTRAGQVAREAWAVLLTVTSNPPQR